VEKEKYLTSCLHDMRVILSLKIDPFIIVKEGTNPIIYLNFWLFMRPI